MMEVTCSSETLPTCDGLHGVITQKKELFKMHLVWVSIIMKFTIKDVSMYVRCLLAKILKSNCSVHTMKGATQSTGLPTGVMWSTTAETEKEP
jgi:hypothetical protein